MSQKTYPIAVITGDGTGPEVVMEGIKVLKAVSNRFGFSLEFHSFPFGGEHYKKTGETLPDTALDELRKFPAILLGAIGHPEVAPESLKQASF